MSTGSSSKAEAPGSSKETVTLGPCVVGLTGGLASGKSTVAAILGDRDVPIFDADRAVHHLYRPQGAGSAAVAELFGPHVLTKEGGVDRDALAALALGGASERRRLEEAIHPLVRKGVADWIAALDPQPVAVVEAALLIETGSYREYDVLLVVWCHLHQQLQRAIARGVPAERARKLIHAQMPLDDKRDLADVVIDNSGDEARLEIEVKRAWSEIRTACGRNPKVNQSKDESRETDSRATRHERRRSR